MNILSMVSTIHHIGNTGKHYITVAATSENKLCTYAEPIINKSLVFRQ